MGSQPIEIWAIPVCATLQGSNIRVHDLLLQLDYQLNNSQSDGQFTEAEFNLAKAGTLGLSYGLSRFKDFDQFKQYLEQTVASQRCTPECKLEGGKGRVRDFDTGREDICIAPPAPNLPPDPKQPVNADKAKGRPKPDISKLDPNKLPAWFDDKPEAEAARPRDVAVAPSADALVVNREREDPLRAIRADNPNLISSDHPVEAFQAEIAMSDFTNLDPVNMPELRVGFDGKSFIMFVHGCIVLSRAQPECIAPWAHFKLGLTNLVSGEKVTKHADYSGVVKVKLDAFKGDVVEMIGSDRDTDCLSLDKLRFKIEQDGSVHLLERIPVYSKCAPKVSKDPKVILQQVPVVRDLIELLKGFDDPKGYMRKHYPRSYLRMFREQGSY